jgi:hypothetical protein
VLEGVGLEGEREEGEVDELVDDGEPGEGEQEVELQVLEAGQLRGEGEPGGGAEPGGALELVGLGRC